MRLLAEIKGTMEALGALVGATAMFGFFIKHITNTSKHCSGKDKVSKDIFEERSRTYDERNDRIDKCLNALSGSNIKIHERIDGLVTKQGEDTIKILQAINRKG